MRKSLSYTLCLAAIGQLVLVPTCVSAKSSRSEITVTKQTDKASSKRETGSSCNRVSGSGGNCLPGPPPGGPVPLPYPTSVIHR